MKPMKSIPPALKRQFAEQWVRLDRNAKSGVATLLVFADDRWRYWEVVGPCTPDSWRSLDNLLSLYGHDATPHRPCRYEELTEPERGWVDTVCWSLVHWEACLEAAPWVTASEPPPWRDDLNGRPCPVGGHCAGGAKAARNRCFKVGRCLSRFPLQDIP